MIKENIQKQLYFMKNHLKLNRNLSSKSFQFGYFLQSKSIFVRTIFGIGTLSFSVGTFKAGKLKNETLSVDYIDYSGSKKTLEINKDTLNEGEKVVIIDDWVQTGATLKSAIKLVESLRGNIVGIVVFMDDSNDVTRDDLSKYNYQYLEKDLKQEEKF